MVIEKGMNVVDPDGVETKVLMQHYESVYGPVRLPMGPRRFSSLTPLWRNLKSQRTKVM